MDNDKEREVQKEQEHEQNEEQEAVREKTIKELVNVEFNIKRRIFQLVMILGMGIGVPIITPEYGASPEDIRKFITIAIPAMLVTIPVGLYKIHRLKTKKRELVEKLWDLDSAAF